MAKEVVEATKKAIGSEAVQAKVLEMLDALQNGAAHIGDQVVKYSPDIANAALWVVRIDGIQSIIGAIVMIPISFLFAKWAKKYYAKLKEDREHDEPPVMLVGVLWIGAITGWVTSLLTLSGVWNWVAVFEPKLYLAKQIIKAALN